MITLMSTEELIWTTSCGVQGLSLLTERGDHQGDVISLKQKSGVGRRGETVAARYQTEASFSIAQGSVAQARLKASPLLWVSL